MRLGLRKDAPTVPRFAGLSPAPTPRARVYDHFAGIAKLPEPPWGTTGCVLEPGRVIVQTYKTDVFRLAVRLGDIWIEHSDYLRPDDPGIRELRESGRLIEIGESPRDRERRERVEAERAREQEAERIRRLGRQSDKAKVTR
jgi:hypothetical protein